MIRFSIIIPTFNRAKTIARALDSLLRQSLKSFEVLIVDDGSSDNTVEIVEPYLKDKRFQYFQRDNYGVSAARNYGAFFSQGEILVFFDSDDEVLPGWLEDFQKLASASDKTCGYLSCGFLYEGEEHLPKSGRQFSVEAYSSAPAGTFAVSRDVFASIGGYDSELRQSENWELAARALTYCVRHNLLVAHTDKCNIIWHNTKSKSQLRERDLATARAYLRLSRKYSSGGILHYRAHRFLLGAAVGFARAGEIPEARRWFYASLWRHPSLKALLRIVCFEIPFLRKKIWLTRTHGIEITED